MTATKKRPSEKNMFGFFSLPAELRDLIYDLLPTAREILQLPNEDCAYCVIRMHQPMRKFTKVNKQFNDEYRARISARPITIHIEDNRKSLPGPFDLVPDAAGADMMTFELICLHNSEDLVEHVEMLQGVVQQMKQCTAIEVGICFETMGGVRSLAWRDIVDMNGRKLRRVTEVAGLRLLEVYVHPKGLADAAEWREKRRLDASYRRGVDDWREHGLSELEGEFERDGVRLSTDDSHRATEEISAVLNGVEHMEISHFRKPGMVSILVLVSEHMHEFLQQDENAARSS